MMRVLLHIACCTVNDVMDDIMEGSGDEEESNAIVSQVLDEIGIDISGQVRKPIECATVDSYGR